MAAVDAATLKPRFLCHALGPGIDVGGDCSSAACKEGLLCVQWSKGPRCALACPGGDKDCGSGKCGSTLLHGFGTAQTSDDVKVAVCVQ